MCMPGHSDLKLLVFFQEPCFGFLELVHLHLKKHSTPSVSKHATSQHKVVNFVINYVLVCDCCYYSMLLAQFTLACSKKRCISPAMASASRIA